LGQDFENDMTKSLLPELEGTEVGMIVAEVVDLVFDLKTASELFEEAVVPLFPSEAEALAGEVEDGRSDLVFTETFGS